MPAQQKDTDPLPRHGARLLPGVEVDSFNLELKDEQGFIGDRASKSAFAAILDKWRAPLRRLGDDPLGEQPSDEARWKSLHTSLPALCTAF